MSKNPYLPEHAEIIDIKQETEVDYTYRLDIDLDVENGQFVEVSIPKVGECPISVSDFGDDYIDLTIRHVGKVTNQIGDLEVGDKLGIRGPYGNGFPMDKYQGTDMVIAAGGTGLAPVKSIINHYYNNPAEVASLTLLLGFKSPDNILFREEIKKWRAAEHIDVILTVDKGDKEWRGNKGLITNFVDQVEFTNLDNMEVIVVGPPIMMKFTTQEFMKHDLTQEQIWVSFERKMSCGIGKCGHCKIDDTYVCVEGPVFNYPTAEKLID
ncbi:sulfite reductase, subunit B [Halobacteroides halobius DSM 5150]|uniref:Sulfite reductase, subunit B n=1 Tax=Halobacteroides halobius (strain ATCC 35273 / DSM 5150 / MD-1) TaxID=748449 RepID=L0K7D6_HALHC|nr:anaerobic sulfite reductase subunit AsrB [Halobacteroides halobius]AGB41197.1 sulfite reductase, subunit B [Halobacteroides halobius DSM 5150]